MMTSGKSYKNQPVQYQWVTALCCLPAEGSSAHQGIGMYAIWDTVKTGVDYFSKGGSNRVEKMHQTM